MNSGEGTSPDRAEIPATRDVPLPPSLERQQTGMLPPPPSLDRQQTGMLPLFQSAAASDGRSDASPPFSDETDCHPPAGGESDANAVSWNVLVEKYDLFLENAGIVPPTVYNRLNMIIDPADRRRAAEFAKRSHPVVIDPVMKLIEEWLNVKREYGSTVEQLMYEGFTPFMLLDRLLKERPVSLIRRNDEWLLPDGRSGEGGLELVGTDLEHNGPLLLGHMLSYDELALSALISMSCPTLFINKGDRRNEAKPGEPGTFERYAIYVGAVGARFEQTGRMEYAHMVVEENQNTPKKGYGPTGALATKGGPLEERAVLLDVWAHFYGLEYFPTYEEAMTDESGRYFPIPNSDGTGFRFLNLPVYKKRIGLVAETLLCEAQERGSEASRPTYVHVVGFGLGVWGMPGAEKMQTLCSLEAWRKVLKEGWWPNVGHLDFSWFGSPDNGIFKQGEVVNGVEVHFSQRDPAAKLPPHLSEHLLVASYAWDSGALPGNEYWRGGRYLSASGDPAAACCSWIAELGNPHINPNVAARNLRVYKAREGAAEAAKC